MGFLGPLFMAAISAFGGAFINAGMKRDPMFWSGVCWLIVAVSFAVALALDGRTTEVRGSRSSSQFPSPAHYTNHPHVLTDGLANSKASKAFCIKLMHYPEIRAATSGWRSKHIQCAMKWIPWEFIIQA